MAQIAAQDPILAIETTSREPVAQVLERFGSAAARA